MNGNTNENGAGEVRAIIGNVPYKIVPYCGEAEELLESYDGARRLHYICERLIRRARRSMLSSWSLIAIFRYNGTEFVVEYEEDVFSVYTPKVYVYLYGEEIYFEETARVGPFTIRSVGYRRNRKYFEVKALSGQIYRIYGISFRIPRRW